MTPTIRRPFRRSVGLVLGLVTALLLTSCGSEPSKVNAAAVVGDHVIDLDDVQAEIQWQLDHSPQAKQAKEQDKVALLSRSTVHNRIVHELASVAAEREQLRVDETAVDEMLGANADVQELARQTGIGPSRVRTVARDQLLVQQLGESYLNRLSVSFVGTIVSESNVQATDSETAEELGRRIAAEPQNAADIVGESGHQVIDETLSLKDAAAQVPGLAVSAVFGAEKGTVVVSRLDGQQVGWLVALIEDRTVGQAGDEQAQQSAGLDAGSLYQIGLRQLQPIADELGVEVNPRYGVWDGPGMMLAASDAEVTGHQWESRTVQP